MASRADAVPTAISPRSTRHGKLLDLPRQFLLARRNGAHHLPGFRVVHDRRADQDFSGACPSNAVTRMTTKWIKIERQPP
jgi:hypothetical protein